jgi:hypothetical protein
MDLNIHDVSRVIVKPPTELPTCYCRSLEVRTTTGIPIKLHLYAATAAELTIQDSDGAPEYDCLSLSAYGRQAVQENRRYAKTEAELQIQDSDDS